MVLSVHENTFADAPDPISSRFTNLASGCPLPTNSFSFSTISSSVIRRLAVVARFGFVATVGGATLSFGWLEGGAGFCVVSFAGVGDGVLGLITSRGGFNLSSSFTGVVWSSVAGTGVLAAVWSNGSGSELLFDFYNKINLRSLSATQKIFKHGKEKCFALWLTAKKNLILLHKLSKGSSAVHYTVYNFSSTGINFIYKKLKTYLQIIKCYTETKLHLT